MSLKILFVDDDPNLINGLKRMLFSKRNEWECLYAENGFKALEILETNDIACIVTDMRMPGMDGAQLLKTVMGKYPQVVRIILSGHSDKEMILRSTQVAHQFLAKPCQSEVLIATISRVLELRNDLNNENLRKIVTGISELPSVPTIYLQLEAALHNEDISVQKIANIISQDMSMTTKILQMVNTAFFGLPVAISNPVQAVNYLGINVIKSLVLYIKLFDNSKNSPELQNYINSIWHHSLVVANYCKELAKGIIKDKITGDDIYAAGLLHDIGRLVLLKLPDYYRNVMELKEKDKINSYEAEKILYGTTHCEVGAYLFRLWGLRDQIIYPVLHHHKYQFNDYAITPVSTVFIANFLSHLNDVNIDYIKDKSSNFNDFSWFKEYINQEQ